MVREKKEGMIPKEAQKVLQKRFKDLKNPVKIFVFTKKGENDQLTAPLHQFTEELMELTKTLSFSFYDEKSKEASTFEVTHFPSMLIQPDHYAIWYVGAPFGEEFRSFLDVLQFASEQESHLSKESKQHLQQLSEKREINVFVTLACPYCPGQVLHAFQAAIERHDIITAKCIDASEQMSLANKYQVGAVPHTVINDETISKGYESEDQFIQELIHLQPMEKTTPVEDSEGQEVHVDLIIIGGGPAGLTAGLYASRSGLQTIILEKAAIGGQVSITPQVENWPGFSSIPGNKLMDMIAGQVREYVPVIQGEEILEIKVGKHIEALSPTKRYTGHALILATGATHRTLGIPGEEEFYGRGVSYCATCDGYLYKNKSVVVIGGGNTALTDALYLKNLGAQVSILHRRDTFTAEQHLISSVEREKIPIFWNTEATHIKGEEMVTMINILNNKTQKKDTIQTNAVFVAIGEKPNNELAKMIGISLDDVGYIHIDRFGRTNIPRIYAAGDLTGGVRQIVTAVGEGASAATSAFQDISQ